LILSFRSKLPACFSSLAFALPFALPLQLLLLQPASAQTITKDIAYTSAMPTEKADLYQPVGTGPFPAILYIHGGSWRSGNKKDFHRLAMDLAGQGFVGFSIDYDLKSHSYPEAWLQAREAVRFLIAHAAEYHIDPTRIVVAGTSAGGELAALLAVDQTGPAGVADQAPVPVAAAMILNGVYDLCFPAYVIKRYLPQTGNSACRDASPLAHIHSGAPPFFIGHGTADHVVPYAAATQFTDALRRSNIFVATYEAEGGPHSYWAKPAYYAANLAAMKSFLQAKVGK
jgi:acetyl esterase/lipase